MNIRRSIITVGKKLDDASKSTFGMIVGLLSLATVVYSGLKYLCSVAFEAGGSKALLTAAAAVCLLVFVILCYWVHHLVGEYLNAKAARDEAASVDYKFSAPEDSASVKKLLMRLNIDLGAIDSKNPVFVSADSSASQNYLPLADFFGDKSLSGDFECTPLKGADKIGKVILQVAFIPVDKAGNIPLILRMPEYHPSARIEKPEFTFVSFSPVPRHYENAFDLLDCYNREVASKPDAFAEYGIFLSKVPKKNASGEKKYVYYLFWVFLSRYDVMFVKNGALDWDVADVLFPARPGSKGCHFTKDHDPIIHAATPDKFSCIVDRSKYPSQDPVLNTIVSDTIFPVESVAYSKGEKISKRFYLDMTKAAFKGVEKSILRSLSGKMDFTKGFNWKEPMPQESEPLQRCKQELSDGENAQKLFKKAVAVNGLEEHMCATNFKT